MQNGKVIAASVIGNIYKNDALKLNAYLMHKFLTRNISFIPCMCYISILYISIQCHYLFRENINRSINTGTYKYSEEKKIQQEKKYKLLNISFRKPVAKGILDYIMLLMLC